MEAERPVVRGKTSSENRGRDSAGGEIKGLCPVVPEPHHGNYCVEKAGAGEGGKRWRYEREEEERDVEEKGTAHATFIFSN